MAGGQNSYTWTRPAECVDALAKCGEVRYRVPIQGEKLVPKQKPNKRDDLFESSYSLLPWLPSETFFSLCSRHHRLWGHGLSFPSTLALFGSKRLGTQHDFPSGLREFVQRTSGLLGESSEIARSRTLLAFYRPFFPDQAVADAVACMEGASVAHLKFRLGLLTSRFRANHPLKACRICMRADVEAHGWVYWHRVHQYPGVWVCPQHGELLDVSTLKSTGVERFQWHLPDIDTLISFSEIVSGESRTQLTKLAEMVSLLVDSGEGDGWLIAPVVRSVLRSRMSNRGWITPNGHVRLADAAREFLAMSRSLRCVSELQALPSNIEEAKTQIGRLLRPMRSGTHPLRWLAAIAWLFDSANDFKRELLHCAATDSVTCKAVEVPVGTVHADALHKSRAGVMQLIQLGCSITAAAQRADVDVATAMSWAAASGLAVKRRPKVLKPEILKALIADLSKGIDKASVAKRYGVSIVTVTRILRTEAGLHLNWKRACLDGARSRARKAWLQALNGHGKLGVKFMRALQPAAYAWLYRNDRLWLEAHKPEAAADLRGPSVSSVRWNERDQFLSQLVLQAAHDLRRTQRSRLKLWQIYQVVPELKPKLATLQRLPLTLRALAQVLEKSVSESGGLF